LLKVIIFISHNLEKVPVRRTGAYRQKKALKIGLHIKFNIHFYTMNNKFLGSHLSLSRLGAMARLLTWRCAIWL